MNILEFKDVHICYKQKEVVKGVSFAVPENSVVAVVGESGSGKTTLIRAAIDLLSSGGVVTGGEILFNGENVFQMTEEEKRNMRGKQMAMIFQDSGAYLNPRVKIGKQYLETLNAHMEGSKQEKTELALKMLKKLNLADPQRIMNSYPFQLSGGMRQRVAIAMAMSMKPGLILADEPTSALDVTVQAQVVKELLNLKEETGTAILIVTHNMGVASKMADHIAVMQNGELKEFGKRDQVIFWPKNDYTKALLAAVPEFESEEAVEEHKQHHRMKYTMMHGEGK